MLHSLGSFEFQIILGDTLIFLNKANFEVVLKLIITLKLKKNEIAIVSVAV